MCFGPSGLLEESMKVQCKDHQVINYIQLCLTCRCELLFIAFQVSIKSKNIS